MLDCLMPEIVLDRPGIVTGIGQGIAASVPEHVGMNRKAELGLSAQALNVAVQGISRERRAVLADKDIGSGPIPPS
jgi:hypothetical protein